MKFKQVLGIMFISAATAAGSVWGYNRFIEKDTYFYTPSNVTNSKNVKTPDNYARFVDAGTGAPTVAIDFTQAASATIPATVHIKTKTTAKASNNLPRRSPFSDLFGDRFEDMFGDGFRSMPMPQQASGSGVIISEDGYIVTNNHVVEGADEISVTLSNRRSFQAKKIGVDPSSDLAILKIDAKGLPFILYGNSDEVKVGQWVLAVGYPLNLETTVTAGIVSAKGRTLEINRRKSETPIESFIQTDAAVNPGNSGGPLVNTDGKLIGINSAIASPTGSYAGYSFTIPVNIVRKVMADLVKFGTVQRAILGVKYAPDNVSEEYKKENGIVDGEGVYVLEVIDEGAAKAAGVKKGDFITKINDVPIYSGADMVGQVATYRPGDKITLSYFRDGKEYKSNLTFKNLSNNTDIVRSSVVDKLGGVFETIPKAEAVDMGVKGGVRVKSIKDKGAFTRTRIEPGYVITKVNGKEVLNLEEFRKEIDKSSGEIKLEGLYPGFEGIFPYKIKPAD